MANDFRTCGKCSLYSHGLGRCIEGKANPHTHKGTKEAIKILGPTYICGYSKWKAKAAKQLVEEMRNEDTQRPTR